MKHRQAGFFDEQEQLQRLQDMGDPLEKLNRAIDWEIFRPILYSALHHQAKGAGGRPPYDSVMMFKILILQEYFGLSDRQTQFQIIDRKTFQHFIGIQSYDSVPDQNTIWTFREQLRTSRTGTLESIPSGEDHDVVKELFVRFHDELERQGMIIHKGKIMDASIMEVPRQRNTRKENEMIKEGCVPDEWENHSSKLSQKDIDARWTKRNGADFFGYKDHLLIDAGAKFIDDYRVTDAAIHDSMMGDELLTRTHAGQTIHADSAYTGERMEKAVKEARMKNRIHEKGKKNHPLTKKQRIRNNNGNPSLREKSKTRARVEHVFGTLKQRAGRFMLRTIGLVRARVKIGMMNLMYNLCRYAYFHQRAKA